MDKYYVIGNPIEHSLSPMIHRQFALQTGQNISYEKWLVPVNAFSITVDQLRIAGASGANITQPFKINALHYADQLTDRARAAGSVNTLKFNGSLCLGDNTDGIGFITDLVDRLKWPLQEQKILIIGAGGAVRGILKNLLDQKPKKVIIINRTESKAEQIVNEFRDYGPVQLADDGPYDLIINGSSNRFINLPILKSNNIFHRDTRGYDVSYGLQSQLFLDWLKSNDCQYYSDGMGMLVAQAAESFYFWRGIRPDIKPILEKLLLAR